MGRKVLFVITGLGQGGTEATLVKILGAIETKKRSNFSVYVLSKNLFFKQQIEKLGVTVLVAPIGINWKFFYFTCNLYKFLRKEKPIVSTWLYAADLYGGIMAKLAGADEIIWSIRQSELSLKHNSLFTYILIKICAFFSDKIPTKIVSCSEVGAQNHISIGYTKTKIKVIPNGFNKTDFPPLIISELRKKYTKPNKIRILHVARNHSQKNNIGFIKVASELSSQIPNSEFVLIGSEIKNLKSNASKYFSDNLRVDENIFFYNEREDIFDEIRKSWCIVQTSINEGFPNVLVEASFLGTLVVATNVGDTKKIIKNDSFLVNNFDPRKIAETILKLNQISIDKKIKLIMAQRAFVDKKFDIKDMVSEYFDPM